MNETIKTLGYPETLIKEYEHWVVLLRPAQVTVGSLVLAAKGGALHLGQLPLDVWAEFSVVAKEAEEMLERAFGAEKFNYLALMMKDPNVHFHLIPRYSRPVKWNGQEYADADWPLKTELRAQEMTDGDIEDIKRTLQRAQR